MRYLKFFTTTVMCLLLFATFSCSSDKSDEPINESSTTIAIREFCKRFGLPEDKVTELKDFRSVGNNNLVMLTGINDLDELAVIICDTIANKALYVNFNQIKFDKEVEVSMPYGEKGTFQYANYYSPVITIDGNNITGALDGVYSSSNSMDPAFIHYRLFLINGKMSVVKLPQTPETLQKKGKVMSWHDGGSLFYFERDDSNPESKLVTCYDNKGNLCYMATYPYFTEIVYPNYDFLTSDLLQPLSNAECLGINQTKGTITVTCANIEDHLLLWQKKDIAIESYEYKNGDRVSLSNQSFSNGILSFTVEVTTYSGSKASYNVAITSNGEVTFPSN